MTVALGILGGAIVLAILGRMFWVACDAHDDLMRAIEEWHEAIRRRR